MTADTSTAPTRQSLRERDRPGRAPPDQPDEGRPRPRRHDRGRLGPGQPLPRVRLLPGEVRQQVRHRDPRDRRRSGWSRAALLLPQHVRRGSPQAAVRGRHPLRLPPAGSPARRAHAHLPDVPDDQLLVRQLRQHRLRRLAELQDDLLRLRVLAVDRQQRAVDAHRAGRRRRLRACSSRCWPTGSQPRGEKVAKTHHLPADGDQRGRRRRRSGGSSTPTNNPGQTQIGLLNAIWIGSRRRPGRLAAADTAPPQQPPAHGDPALGAGRLLDGAALRGGQGRARATPSRRPASTAPSERQIFFRVVVPQIKGTIITVFITVTHRRA